MLLKILLLIFVILAVYWIFFKKKPLSPPKESSDEMLKCERCATYVSTREALLSGGHYYCSRECLGEQP